MQAAPRVPAPAQTQPLSGPLSKTGSPGADSEKRDRNPDLPPPNLHFQLTLSVPSRERRRREDKNTAGAQLQLSLTQNPPTRSLSCTPPTPPRERPPSLSNGWPHSTLLGISSKRQLEVPTRQFIGALFPFILILFIAACQSPLGTGGCKSTSQTHCCCVPPLMRQYQALCGKL